MAIFILLPVTMVRAMPPEHGGKVLCSPPSLERQAGKEGRRTYHRPATSDRCPGRSDSRQRNRSERAIADLLQDLESVLQRHEIGSVVGGHPVGKVGCDGHCGLGSCSPAEGRRRADERTGLKASSRGKSCWRSWGHSDRPGPNLFFFFAVVFFGFWCVLGRVGMSLALTRRS